MDFEFDIGMSSIFPTSLVKMIYSDNTENVELYSDNQSDEIDIAPCGIEDGIDSKFTAKLISLAG